MMGEGGLVVYHKHAVIITNKAYSPYVSLHLPPPYIIRHVYYLVPSSLSYTYLPIDSNIFSHDDMMMFKSSLIPLSLFNLQEWRMLGLRLGRMVKADHLCPSGVGFDSREISKTFFPTFNGCHD